MAFEPCYAVDGSRVPASMLRRDKHQSSGGARGITLPTDLRVTATGTPSGSVNISRGSGVAPSPWRPGESYMVANASADLFDIPATGSSGGRTEYVVVKVRDHHYDGGQAPADPTVDSYTEVTRVSSLSGLNFPYVPLAKLTIPASTATITNAMISDIREVANPRMRHVPRTNALLQSESETLTLTRDDGEFFPNAGAVQQIDIPEWATRVDIRCQLNGLLLDSAASTGRLWVGWGELATSTRREFNTQETSYAGEASSGRHRVGSTVADYMVIPPAYRGRKSVQFNCFGRRVTGMGATMDGFTNMVWDVYFKEVPDASDS